jgi:hypothetical protein
VLEAVFVPRLPGGIQVGLPAGGDEPGRDVVEDVAAAVGVHGLEEGQGVAILHL